MKHPDARIQALLDRLASPALDTIDLSLDRMWGLLQALGNPQEKLPPVVHVAGTNGKGSLLAYLDAIVQAAGYKAHRYISPHLVRFNERILPGGREIEDARLLELLGQVAAHMDRHPVTFFEATTAVAFLAFAQTPADIVLLETGLGGRLDATNVVRAPLLTAITPLSMDHMDYLGDTLAAIAAEKAGILKRGAPCVAGPQSPEAQRVIQRAAETLGVSLYRAAEEWHARGDTAGFQYISSAMNAHFPMPGLAGAHQILNAGTAIACIEHLTAFTISKEHIAHGLAHARWHARLERLTSGRLAALMPLGSELWLDGGHNPGAGEVLARWAASQTRPVHLICGMLTSKDSKQFLAPLAPYVNSVTAVTIENEPQSQPVELIAASAQSAGISQISTFPSNNIKNAIEIIVKNNENGLIILICGSLYLAGNILWQNSQPL